jgi:hypothetical protein
MNYIGWPGEFEPSPYNFHAVIDCSAHTRLRIHTVSTEYYRGDKNRHIMVSQIICGLQGAVYDVVLGKGHNNDHLSGMKFHTELGNHCIILDFCWTYMVPGATNFY